MNLHRKICWCFYDRIHYGNAALFLTKYSSPMSGCPPRIVHTHIRCQSIVWSWHQQFTCVIGHKRRHKQSIVGTLLYYTLAVDPTLLVWFGYIASEHSKATSKNAEAWKCLMGYSASKHLSIIRYTALGMVLYIHSDASFLSESQARSRTAGHFY